MQRHKGADIPGGLAPSLLPVRLQVVTVVEEDKLVTARRILAAFYCLARP